MPKILVTGVNGFVGKHLLRELKTRGHKVIGLGNEPSPYPDVLKLVDKYEVCDLTDATQVARLDLSTVGVIINLAGLANVGASFDAEALYKKINVEVLAKLGQRLYDQKSEARLIAISTGAVYEPNQILPLTESSKTIQDSSPYALSKLLMEDAALKLRKDGLDCVIVRPFNHFGPGQLPGFLIPDLYQKIMQAKQDGGAIRVGNLDTKRDYTDVRDVARAYADLATADTLESNIYNVCSGKPRSGEKILNLMLKKLNVKNIEVKIDRSLIRPNDPKEIYGSYSRLDKEINWQPQISFEQTIAEYVKWATSN